MSRDEVSQKREKELTNEPIRPLPTRRRRRVKLDGSDKVSKGQYDFWILAITFSLLILGLIMVFSATGPYAQSTAAAKYDPYYFFKNQAIFGALGIGGMIFFMKFDYKFFKKLAWPAFIVSLILLVLVFVPPIGLKLNGASRWINLGITTFQPSELAKFAIIILFALMLSKHPDPLKKFGSLVPYFGILIVVAALLIKEPHMSGLIVIGLTAVIIMIVAGARIRHFLVCSAPVILAAIYLVVSEPYRFERILTFLDPFKDASDTGWQVANSLYAIGSGGIFGRGLGKSIQKFLYIPEPQNDFILSIVAEEIGLIGVLGIMILFAILFWRGIKIAMNAPDVFGSYVAVGIVAIIAIQVIINIAVVTSSVPVTGMPLPFFSAGGTSLTLLMCEIGVLLNISSKVRHVSEDEAEIEEE